MHAFAALITVTRPSGVVETLRLTDGPVTPFGHDDPDMANAIFRQRLSGPPAYSVGVSADLSRLAGDVGGGVLGILNGDGAYSWLPGCAPGPIEVRWGNPGDPWAAWTPIVSGLALPPAPTLSARAAGRIDIGIVDLRGRLDTDVETTTYGGSNVGVVGYDGTPETIRGQALPLCLGRPLHVPAVAVNTVGRAWRYDAGPAGGPGTLYDRGDPAGLSLVATATSAAFDAAVLGATQYAHDPARGLVRLGGSIGGDLGMDPVGRSAAGTTAPEAIRWLLGRRGVGIIGASLSGWASPRQIGAWWGGAVTYREAVETMARSEGAVIVPDALGRWQAVVLDAPAAPIATISEREVIDIQIDDADLLTPVWKVTVFGQRNHLVLDRQRQAQALWDTERGAWLSEEWRRAVASSATTKARWGDDAREAEIRTALTSLSDMEALASRMLALLGPRPDGTPRQSLALTLPMTTTRLGWPLGASVHLDYPREGIGHDVLVLGRGIASPDRHAMRVRVFG